MRSALASELMKVAQQLEVTGRAQEILEPGREAEKRLPLEERGG